jgi:hypothetical protein
MWRTQHLAKIGVVVVAALLAQWTARAQQSSWSDVLDLNDRDARALLHEMTRKGDLTTKEHAAAWIVLATVAQGAGLEHCAFPGVGDDLSFLWKPALDGMSSEEAKTLNRIVTSNYRNAEKSGRLRLDLLFPITREAVASLSTQGRYNCRAVSEVWQSGRAYVRAKGM